MIMGSFYDIRHHCIRYVFAKVTFDNKHGNQCLWINQSLNMLKKQIHSMENSEISYPHPCFTLLSVTYILMRKCTTLIINLFIHFLRHLLNVIWSFTIVANFYQPIIKLSVYYSTISLLFEEISCFIVW